MPMEAKYGGLLALAAPILYPPALVVSSQVITVSEAQEMVVLEELILHHAAPELDADAENEEDQAVIALLQAAMLVFDQEDVAGLHGE